MSDFAMRFGGIGRLYGAAGLAQLRAAHVCVVGIGGVGSWVVEALARSGIGRLTLVDLDEICVSNVNRQLPAMDGAIGLPKIEVMAQRVRAINPECQVQTCLEFFTPETAPRLLEPQFDYVCDAIDHVPNKGLLISLCRKRSIPVITTGGAGGRRNPAAVQLVDLAFSTHDRLLAAVRRELRLEHDFPKEPKVPFQVPCVFSSEPQVFPKSDGTVCAAREENGGGLRLNCDSGYGTATFVTGAFGFVAAAHIVGELALCQAPLSALQPAE